MTARESWEGQASQNDQLKPIKTILKNIPDLRKLQHAMASVVMRERLFSAL